MAVTIPAMNRVTQAHRTPAPQTAVDYQIKYRDAGVDEAVGGIVKTLGMAAARAEEAKETGMSNAFYREAVRRADKTMFDMQNDDSNHGYGSVGFVERFRKAVADEMSDLQKNGFILEDKSVVAAPNERVWKNVVDRMDARLIQYDSTAMKWAADEIAKRETKDFEAAVAIALDTVLNSDSPDVQASASLELQGLARAYFQGRAGEEAIANFARENMKTVLETRQENYATADPLKALQDQATNPNYKRFGANVAKSRQTAIANIQKISGLNRALYNNGMPMVTQNWDDATLKALLSPSEYAEYSIGADEIAATKSAAIAGDTRRTTNELNLQTMIKAANVSSQDDMNKLVEEAEKLGTSNAAMQTIQQVNRAKDDDYLFQQRVSYVDSLSDVDGEFNEVAARVQAGLRAEAIGIGNELPPLKQAEAREDYIKERVALERARYYDERSKLDVESLRAPQSAEYLQEFYASLQKPNAPIAPADVKNFENMTAMDRAAVTGVLLNRAQMRKSVEEIERSEGGTFDLSKIALDQWKNAGERYVLDSKGNVEEGDAEAFSAFSDRFKELYIQEYKNQHNKPDAEGIARIARVAYETYRTNPGYEQLAKDLGEMRRVARDSYADKPIVTQPELRDEIRNWFEASWWGRLFKDDGNIDSDTRQALVDLYEDMTVPEQQLLVKAIASGNDSLVYHLLKQKGF